MSFNTSQYKLNVDGFSDSFNVQSFTVSESICGLDRLEVIVSSEESGFEYDELVGKKASFSFSAHGDEQYFHGLILAFFEEPTERGQSQSTLIIEPQHNLLAHGTDCKVYRNTDLADVFRKTLAKAGVSGPTLDMQLKNGNTKLDFVVQYNESDFDFYKRISERHGVFSYILHKPDFDVLVVANENTSFISGTLDDLCFVPGSGMGNENPNAITHLQRSHKLQTGKISMRSYNYETPLNEVRNQAGNAQTAPWNHFDSALENEQRAGQYAMQWSEATRAARETINGVCHTPGMRVGHCFNLAAGDHPTGFEGEYVVIAVKHSGSQEAAMLGSGKDSPYTNRFVAQPRQIPFRRPCITQKPKVNGVLVARVEGQDNDYATLDDQGRYTVKLPFDIDDHGNSSSYPVRMSQPHAGPGYGHHFPLHKDADVVLAFEDGDIDRPIVLGSTPNPSQASPVSQDNRTENIISTACGHRMVFDDKAGQTQVSITTAGGLKIVLDDTPDSQGITLSTPKSHSMHFSEKLDSLNMGLDNGAYNLCMDKPAQRITLSSQSGSTLAIDDQKKMVELLTASGMAMQMDDAKNSITIRDSGGSHLVTIDSAGGKVIISSAGDVEVAASKNITMNASGDLSLTATGNMTLEGAKIKIAGSQGVVMESTMAMDLSAQTNLTLKATVNGEFSAGAMQKISGTASTAVESTGITTIQGTLVKIN